MPIYLVSCVVYIGDQRRMLSARRLPSVWNLPRTSRFPSVGTSVRCSKVDYCSQKATISDTNKLLLRLSVIVWIRVTTRLDCFLTLRSCVTLPRLGPEGTQILHDRLNLSEDRSSTNKSNEALADAS